MIEERLKALCPVPLEVIWHENKTVFISVRKMRGRLLLRLHRLFLASPTPVIEALAKMALKRDRSAQVIVRKMAHLYFSQNQIPAEILPTKGDVYDLQEIAEEVKKEYFTPDLSPAIGWTPLRKSRLRSITFGTYDRHRHQIRINKLLDNPQVPLYFVAFIVYHEMLHAVIPGKIDSAGRCRVHTAEFRARERQFNSFEKAKKWEKNCFKSLTIRKINK